MSSNHVAAVLAYNRHDLTLACPRSLRAQNVPDLVVDAYVLDDASVNGTGEGIARLFPDVRVLHGDGTFYWNDGMQTTFAAAMHGAVTALHASVGFPGAALSTWRVR